MKTEKTNKLTGQTYLSLVIVGIGILIMVYGIIVEDEPTAVALLLIVTGTAWFLVTRFRQRLQSRKQ